MWAMEWWGGNGCWVMGVQAVDREEEGDWMAASNDARIVGEWRKGDGRMEGNSA